MTHSYEKPSSVYEQLSSIRMSGAQRREAIAHMQRAEAIADLIVSAARFLRRLGRRAPSALNNHLLAARSVDYDKR
jgi:hypothetical protein